MKLTKNIIIVLALLTALPAMASGDLKDLLNSVTSGKSSSDNNSNPLGSLGSVISNLTASSSFELADLQGTWDYQSPAVTFQSDNVIQKAG